MPGPRPGLLSAFLASWTGVAAATPPTLGHSAQLQAADAMGGGFFGCAAAGGSDLNGDGRPDAVVGACLADGTEAQAGAAYVYLGADTGLSAASEIRLDAPAPAVDGVFGGAVALLGDANGDGHGDLVIAADASSDALSGSGAVFLWLGSASGVVPAAGQALPSSGASAQDQFAAAIGAAGDVNGDGRADLIVGAPGIGADGTRPGSAWLFLGQTSGLSAAASLLGANDAPGLCFGCAVAGAGDLDGDGLADVIVGAEDDDGGAGTVSVFYGAEGAPEDAPRTTLVRPAAEGHERLGAALSAAGDVNADGYADIILGAPHGTGLDEYTGAAHVYLGSAAGPQNGQERTLFASDGGTDDVFGGAVAEAGDFNGDGFDDVLIGADGDNDQGSRAGAAYLYLGSPSGTVPEAELKLLPDGGASRDHAGLALTGLGDVDADGFADLLIGAPGADAGGAEAGVAYTWAGTCGHIWYIDGDGDGYGTAEDRVWACEAPLGYADRPGDCADAAAEIHPGQPEICDPIDADEDCSGTADDDDPGTTDAGTWYADQDGDGYGDPGAPTIACDAPSGHVADASDCDDSDARIHPGADEAPDDGTDSDCDGADPTTETPVTDGDTGTFVSEPGSPAPIGGGYCGTAPHHAPPPLPLFVLIGLGWVGRRGKAPIPR